MKTKIVVIDSQGYWGAGEDLKTAVKNALGLHGFGVIYFLTLGDGADAWVDGMGALTWKGEMVSSHKMYYRNGRIVVDPDKKTARRKS